MRKLFSRRTLIISAASFTGIVLTLALIAYVLVRTGKLDDWVAGQFKSALAEYGVRMEVGSLQTSIPSFAVEMHDLKLYAEGIKEPFANLDHLTAKVTTKNLIGFIGFGRKGEVQLDELMLDGLRASYKIDSEGHSNLQGIKLPKKEKPDPFDFSYSTAKIELRNAEINYIDAVHKLDGTARNLAVTLHPNEKQPMRVVASAEKSSFVFDGRESENISFKLDGRVDESSAQIDSLHLDSPFTIADLKGEMKDWRNPAYKLDAKAEIKLREAAHLFLPQTRLNGAAQFEGIVEGTGIEYQAKGKLRSENIIAQDIRISGFSLTASGTGKDKEYQAQEEMAFRQLSAAGFRVNRVIAAGKIVGDGLNFSWLGKLGAEDLSGENFNASGVSLKEARLKGDLTKLSSLHLSGRATVEKLVTADVPVGRIEGELTATRDEVFLPNFKGAVFGGEARGSARVSLNGRGASEVNAEIIKLNLDQATAVASGKRLPLRGLTDGNVKLAWRGNDYKSAEGTVNLKFNGATLRPGESEAQPGSAVEVKLPEETAPVSGELNAILSGRRIKLEHTELQTGATRIALGGDIGWDKTGALDFDLNSTDAAQLQSIATDFASVVDSEPIKVAIEKLQQNEVQLTNKISLNGRVTGSLDAPQVNARFALEGVNLYDEPLGLITGDLSYETDTLRLTNGSLTQSNGGRVEFAINYPFKSENGGSLQARLNRYSLGSALRLAASLPVSVAGEVTGNAELTGLPGAIRANAELSIAKAKFGDNAFDEAGGRFTFDGTRVEVNDLKLRSGSGTLGGSAAFDLNAKGYRVNLRGDGLDIAPFVAAAREGESGIPLTGRVNVQIEAVCEKFTLGEKRGRIFDRLDATLASVDLSFRGTRLGRTQIKLDGRDSIANIKLDAEVFGQPYAGTGKVDFGDAAAPIQMAIDFKEMQLAPVIDLAAGRDFDATGNATGQMRVTGNLFGSQDQAHIEVDFSKLGFEFGDYRLAAQPPVALKINTNQLDFGTVRFSGTNTNLEMTGMLALSERGRNNFAIDGDVNLRVLQSFVPNVFADGLVRLQGAASGTYKQPRFSGTATLQDGVLRSPGFPLALTKAKGRMLFTADQAQVESLTAEVGGGKLSLVGGASLTGLRPARWRFQMRTEGVRLDYPRDVRTTLDGDLELQGSPQLQVLGGIVNVRRTEYLADVDLFEFIARMTEEFGNANISAADAGFGIPPTQLDVRVVANDTLTLHTKSLDIVGSAALVLRGPVDDPSIGGRITISRGTIDNIFNERYRLNSGTIEFSGVDKRPPRLNIEAEADRLGYRLIVPVAGSVDQLRITPRSEPPLPQADVIALITTGKLANEGGTLSSSQALAQTSVNTIASVIAQPLSRNIESNVTGRLFGLNRFSIDPLLTGRGTDPTARITVGRQVTKDLSISYSTNLASNQDQVILVEYRVSDRLSLVASRAQTGTFGFDVRLRKRF